MASLDKRGDDATPDVSGAASNEHVPRRHNSWRCAHVVSTSRGPRWIWCSTQRTFARMTAAIETRALRKEYPAPTPRRGLASFAPPMPLPQGRPAAVVVLPIARLIMGPIQGLSVEHILPFIGVTALGALTFSALGLLMGTAIAPQQIGLMFSIIIAPMLMFGCAYYPWRGLDRVPVMKYLVLVNPLVYLAEGMRGAITPDVPHMPIAVSASALVLLAGGFWYWGMRSFYKRAIG